jgi:transcriptional antiterminator RfaH
MVQPFWSVVRTHPNAESIATHHLQRQSFDYYQPLITERKKRQGKIHDCVSPLFPCYLFVRIESRWLCLQSTHGIAAVLTMGAQPAKVADNVVSELKSRENSSGLVVLPKQRFGNGDTVKIGKGAFEGQLALIENMPANERQKVLLSLLSNTLIKVSIDEVDLEVA